MGIKEAVIFRISELCRDRNIKLNALANLSGVTASTVYSMFDGTRKDVGIVAVKKLCDGLDITIIEFFEHAIFRDLEQEIK